MYQPRVLLVTSEAVPLVKTGGLADVIGALAAELSAQGVDVSILMPGYPAAMNGALGLKKLDDLPDLPGGSGELYQGNMPDTGVKVLLMRTDRFDTRLANPYVDHSGHELDDNALAFASLAHTAVLICEGKTSVAVPHVVHANDWHAGLIPALMRAKKITNVGTVLTVHNLAFQGNYAMELAPEIGIPEALLVDDSMEFWGQLSFLKAGISYADRVTTVSETYAREILTERFGYGFEGVLNKRKDALLAIPNGVDLNNWSPATDTLIKRNFSKDNLSGKAACKRDLQKLFNLPVEQFVPLIAIGSRITHQKMADVVLQALPDILAKHPRLQIALLGCGEPQYEQAFKELAAQYPDRIGVFIGYDERRAHALHAGADILLHPTRFEPFGLTPIYSMLYGTLPIGSRVGGMCDTIIDAGSEASPDANATGILFDGEQAADLSNAVDRALALYARPTVWQAMQRNATHGDFSWSGPARSYIEMYTDIAPAAARASFVHLLEPDSAPPSLDSSIYKMTA
jgi:starch synthase